MHVTCHLNVSADVNPLECPRYAPITIRVSTHLSQLLDLGSGLSDDTASQALMDQNSYVEISVLLHSIHIVHRKAPHGLEIKSGILIKKSQGQIRDRVV